MYVKLVHLSEAILMSTKPGIFTAQNKVEPLTHFSLKTPKRVYWQTVQTQIRCCRGTSNEYPPFHGEIRKKYFPDPPLT